MYKYIVAITLAALLIASVALFTQVTASTPSAGVANAELVLEATHR